MTAAAGSYSIVVPVTGRAEPLRQFYTDYSSALSHAEGWEFVFVASAEGAHLLAELEPLKRAGEPIRLLHAGQVARETLLIHAASTHCRGEFVVVLPPHHRVAPDSIATLVERLRQGADVVVARRFPRKQSRIDQLKNRVYHRLLAMASGQRFHDLGAGVRGMRRSVLTEIPIYGDLSPFLPVFASRAGLRVEEVKVPQQEEDLRPRIRDGAPAYLHRSMDLLNLAFLLRFSEKPLRFFGSVGSLLSLSGLLVLAVLLVQRLGGTGIADRPLLVLGALLLVLGAQAIALGLIGEVIVHLHASSRRGYTLMPPDSESTQSGREPLVEEVGSSAGGTT